MSSELAHTVEQLHEWLAPCDGLPLECDGLTRVTSGLFTRDGIAHTVMVGRLATPHGVIAHHWWIDLDDDLAGLRVDFRARMWLGAAADVPHGVFVADAVDADYQGEAISLPFNPTICTILAGEVFAHRPRFQLARVSTLRPA